MRWNEGWHHGGGWFVPGLIMALIMAVAWGSIAWIIVSSLHRGSTTRTAPPRSVDPEQLLHERLARGEIDVDEYGARLGALRANRSD
jgi:putative membrane protein